MFYYFWFDLGVGLLILILQSHKICFVILLALSLSVIILNYLTFMSFVSFGTHNFGDKTLQPPVHLSKLIINR